MNRATVAEKESITKTAGRGTIYITASKVYFIVSGYGIYFALPRLFSPQQFGLYSVVTGIVSIINAVIVIGTQQAVSKFVSEDVRQADAVKRQAIKLQAMIGGGITLIYLLSAPLIANLVSDPSLVTPLRISALIPISYSFYSVYIGYLNGQKKFLRQSLLDMSYSTLKVVFIVGLAFTFHSVGGSVLGFGLAAVAVLSLAPLLVGKADNQIDHKPSTEAFIKFQFALLGNTLINNLLQKQDLLIIKTLGSKSSSVASEMAGYYSAQMAVANITYQAIISIAFIIFPLVSNATFEERTEEVKDYIRQTIRFSLMIMGLGATIFSSNASQVLHLLYRENYQAGAPALVITAYGMLCFGLIYILTTIISGSGRPRVSLMIGLGTLMAAGVLNSMLVPRYGLWGAAVGTSVAMGAGALIAGLYVFRAFGACVNLRSAASISIAAAVAYQIALIFPAGDLFNPIGLIFKLISQVVIYLTVLILLREIGRREIDQIRKII
jgi:O-antigen/teichoic acid export membrane protein